MCIHLHTGWRRLIGCLKLQVNFRKSATKYRALFRKMTYKDKASYDYTPPCRVCVTYHICHILSCMHMRSICVIYQRCTTGVWDVVYSSKSYVVHSFSKYMLYLSHIVYHQMIDPEWLERTATHCNTLQLAATHCNSLWLPATQVAIHCNPLQHIAELWD